MGFRIATPAIALAVLFTAPTGARASEVALESAAGGTVLTYRAAPGEVTDLHVNLQGANYTLQDSAGSNMTIAPPCEPMTVSAGAGTAAMCPARDVKRMDLAGSDQTDSLSVGGISSVLIPITVSGGRGPDSMRAGAGDDIVDAFDGEHDSVACGQGDDVVYADPGDSVDADCEKLLFQPAPANPGPPRFDASAKVAAAYRVARLRAHGLRVSFACSASCEVSSRLVLKRGSRQVTLSKAKAVRVSGNGAGRIKLKLTGRGRRLLAGIRRAPARVITDFTGPSANLRLTSSVLLRR
jgi:hypothetical protein